MKTPSSSPLLFPTFIFLFLSFSSGQQSYISNFQLNCYDTNSSSALGYSCNSPSSSCSSFLIFRPQFPYDSPDLISFLLSADAGNISRLNSVVSSADPLPTGRPIVVPIPCSCSGRFYQHNASYTLKSLSETYFTVANDTYQGLSTCQSLIDQNPFDSHGLSAGDRLVVPLRCACPSVNQIRSGTKYLVSYLVAEGDDIHTIAQIFSADYQEVMFANGLNEKSTIYPFTTVLIPLFGEPTKISIPTPSSPPNVPNAPSAGGSGNAGVLVGVAAGVSLLLLLGVLLCLFFWLKKRRRRIQQSQKKESESEMAESGQPAFKKEKKKQKKKTTTTTTIISSPKRRLSPLASSIREMLDWITVYTFEELLRATGGFDEENRIKGSVYLGVINGVTAAIKRVEGNVTREIRILKRISHSNVIKLSGLCLHEENTYMIYEFAERGSLSDWLQHKNSACDSYSLNWKQRIQIACDVADGLNYLHNYSNPPYIHKNLKSSNVLLGGDFRAKIANLGMARGAEENRELVTRHVVGTRGYLAPEYLEHGLITPMLDVFAFGVILLELLSGREAIFVREDEKKGEVLLWKAIQGVLDGEDGKIAGVRGFVDGCLGDDYPPDLAFAMAELAKRCVSRDAGSRPTMDELLVSLSAIHNSTRDWDVEDGVGSSSAGSAIPKRDWNWNELHFC